jgi:hypothetical protein
MTDLNIYLVVALSLVVYPLIPFPRTMAGLKARWLPIHPLYTSAPVTNLPKEVLGYRKSPTLLQLQLHSPSLTSRPIPAFY